MLDKLYEFLYTNPQEARTVGALLQRASFVLLLIGLLFRVSVLVIEMMQGLMPASARETTSIAQFLPDFPTWWIPESIPAFALVVLVGIAGVLLSMEAKKWQRILDAM